MMHVGMTVGKAISVRVPPRCIMQAAGPAVQTTHTHTQRENRAEHCRSVFITACLLYLLSLFHTKAFCFRHTHTSPCILCTPLLQP